MILLNFFQVEVEILLLSQPDIKRFSPLGGAPSQSFWKLPLLPDVRGPLNDRTG